MAREPQVPRAAAGWRGAAGSAAVRRARRVCGCSRALATWGGLGLEALIALLCLCPAGRIIEAARHAALLLFCATTYALAPVAGFGWLIAVMGLAQCRPHAAGRPGAYIAVFLLILMYAEIPWTGVLADWTLR